MINSFGTGKPTEADGSGRGTGKRTEAAAAVRLFGCSAVRAAAALLPRMESGERSYAPTAAGASSFLFLVLLFLRLSPIGGSGEGKIHRCAGGCAVGGSPPPHGERRA